MKRLIIALSILCLSFQGLSQVHSAPQLNEGVLIRDAEIEQGLIDFLTPLFKVAGLDPSQIKILLLNSSEVNAAAGLNFTLIINTGLLSKTENVGQLIGVLAHETGHVAGRHNERLISSYSSMQIPAMAMMVLAGAAAFATKSPEAMMAGAAGMDMIDSTLMSYHRSHESAADQAAFKYLDKLGWSSEGFFEFMKILHKQEMLSDQHQFAYKRTHPFMIERLRLVERHVESSRATEASFPPGFEEKFNRMRVKIQAYTDFPDRIIQQYPFSDNSLLARYARTIALHRKSHTQEALRELDSLISEYPNDPYFLELKGQILFESGRVKDSYSWYKKAIDLIPQNSLLKIEFAHVLLEQNDRAHDKEALDLLRSAERHESESPFYWRLYATAYGRLGDEPMATLMLAEEALCYGKVEEAHNLAARALKGLKTSSGAAKQRAKDIQEIELPEDTDFS